MSKVMLVASREYVENLRTKTFWLGILSVPVMLLIFITVPRLLDKARDVRRYSVIDHSGWLHAEIQERANYDDALQLLQFLRGLEEGTKAYEKLPTFLRPLLPLAQGASDTALTALAKTMSVQGKGFLDATGEPDSNLVIAEQVQQEFLNWLTHLSLEQARLFGLKHRQRYHLVDLPDGEDLEPGLREKLDREELFAYFVIGPDPLDEAAGHKYVSNNRTDGDLKSWISRLATEEIQSRRFQREEHRSRRGPEDPGQVDLRGEAGLQDR